MVLLRDLKANDVSTVLVLTLCSVFLYRKFIAVPVPTITLSGSAVAGIMPQLRGLMDVPFQPQTVRLGRIRPASRPQCLRFALYTEGVTPPPPSVDYAAKAAAIISQMYLNDRYGDCVIAGKYHAIGTWYTNDGGPAQDVLATTQEIWNSYQTICGPGDNGCNIASVLNYFRDHGLKCAGNMRKIDGYVSIDWTNKLEVQVALFLFGAITIGINLPAAWESSAIWDVTNSQIVGGHDVTIIGYNDQGVQISSWGRVYTITWAAVADRRFLEEAYVMLSPDWYGADNLAPSGFDVAALKADLAKLGGGSIPPLDPPVPVPPPEPPVPVPPVVQFPNYSGTLTATVMGYPVTGTISLTPQGTSFAAFPSIWVILPDVLAVYAAYNTGNVPAMIAAVKKLATDLGIVLPPLPPI